MTRFIRTLSLALVGAAALAGCATGPRPTLVDAPATDDPAIAGLIDMLGKADDATFTAEYLITVNYGGNTVNAAVAQSGPERSVTVGDIRYLWSSASQRTCTLVTGECANGIDDTRISDVQVTHQFWGRAMALRIRTDAGRDIGPARSYSVDVAGITATCAVIPVTGGDKSYCVTEAGPLAMYLGPDVSIELTSWSPEANPDLFGVGTT
jgi:hypothetical protein